MPAKTRICRNGHDKQVVGIGANYNCKGCLSMPEKAKYKVAWAKAKRTANPDKYRDQRWKRTGICNLDGSPFSSLDYDRMYQYQSGKCAICGIHSTERKDRLAIDHSHSTGRARKLLCQPCNARLGVIGDAAFSEKARLYLEAHNG